MSFYVLRIAGVCLAWLVLTPQLGCSQKARPVPVSAAAPSPAPAPGVTAGPSAPLPPQPPLPIVDPTEPPRAPPELVSSYRPAESDAPAVAAIKLRIARGEASTKTIKELQKLCNHHTSDAELPYLLGQLYFARLWVGDGLKAFRRALAIDPQLRENPFLIRATVSGLANDSDHRQVAKFLSQEVGPPAAPYLEEVLYSDARGAVKERAESILRSLR